MSGYVDCYEHRDQPFCKQIVAWCNLKLDVKCVIYEGCPKMPFNCIISLKFKTNISLIYMHPEGNLFLDILLKQHKIS